VQFVEADFAEVILSALEKSALDPKWLEIEITETVVLRDLDIVKKNLARLKDLGIATTIDDFGTGYSSIAYLRQMPLDCLKIDRSYIKDILGEDLVARRNQTLVKAFISLAQNLGLNLVAEGIENSLQRQLLSELGCEWGQGFLFSAPLPAGKVTGIFEKEMNLTHK
jgi:EAL domain-containing protein (putative c-di-GMP-specific phosphodiesterase class I)